MKREDLEKLGLSKEQIDAIMAENGKDIEAHKTKITAAETSAEALKKQLEEANKAIEGFKGLDIEGVKKQAEEWKSKAEQAEKDAAAQLSQLKFDHALDGALTSAKAKNAKAVKALLNIGDMKLSESGEIFGLKEQLEKVKADADYLFESDTPTPKVTAAAQGTPQTETGSLRDAIAAKLNLKG